MAKPIKLYHLTATTIFFFLIISQSSSSARPLNGFYPNSLAATEPALNLALPGDNGASPPEKDSSLPCEMDSSTEILAPKRLGGKYGLPLVLNMLPKGPAPPSGPSKGTNNIKN
uniref:Uncharacterized protein n=1 Tax=Davidia involucrata TaxID=16924 RepID=A0A5B7CB11_DAVIN